MVTTATHVTRSSIFMHANELLARWVLKTTLNFQTSQVGSKTSFIFHLQKNPLREFQKLLKVQSLKS